MAAIDHTDIVFKNGEWMKEPYSFGENDEYINHCPFEYGRDGNIHTVGETKIYDDIRWYRDEYDAVYERDGWRNWGTVRKTPHGIWAWFKYHLGFMHKIGYRQEVGVWANGDGVEVYIYHDELNQSYVSFYSDGTDTYVVIGGYGHWKNVYCHFMARGYGDEFEEKMAAEAYKWACEKVLVDISESICGGSWELEEDFVNNMRERFGYEDPYRIVCREE
jgi:hypothetical protein